MEQLYHQFQEQMAQMSSLDTIINKYRDRLNSEQGRGQQRPEAIRKDFTPMKRVEPPTDHKSLRASSFENSQKNPYLYTGERQPSRSISKPSLNREHDGGMTLAKYKQTLGLYYDQVSKTQTLQFQVQCLGEKLKVAESKIAELEHLRLNEKIEYVQKLEILNGSELDGRSGVSPQLVGKVEELEKEVWYLRRNEEGYRIRVKELEDVVRVGSGGRERLKTYTYHNPPNHEMSFYHPPNLPNHSTQLTQLKQTLQKLQHQHSTILNQNQQLREEMQSLNSYINRYKHKVLQLEQELNQRNQNKYPKSHRQRTRRTKRNDTQSNTEESGSQIEHGQGRGNQELERKLKNLERDYEKICSQMLTVESAKKIAKQTSRYYNKKTG